ncbi:hypothetical protein B0A48_03253 [Cryoendolithus antarcticus]|uniref:C2H2-type domain-containing protein n=1 Tax=Cryoendolithus antarcticus TaxID=1507870 RepID=A0A1V8TJI2_9PEZI|nr:hypothetical protein B0A48_03253 [Cryoendolithus antarcticus]
MDLEGGTSAGSSNARKGGFREDALPEHDSLGRKGSTVPLADLVAQEGLSERASGSVNTTAAVQDGCVGGDGGEETPYVEPATGSKLALCLICKYRPRNVADAERHHKKHAKSFKCPYNPCRRRGVGFANASDLDQHLNSGKHNTQRQMGSGVVNVGAHNRKRHVEDTWNVDTIVRMSERKSRKGRRAGGGGPSSVVAEYGDGESVSPDSSLASLPRSSETALETASSRWHARHGASPEGIELAREGRSANIAKNVPKKMSAARLIVPETDRAGRDHLRESVASLDPVWDSKAPSHVASTASSSSGDQRTRLWSDTNDHTSTLPSMTDAFTGITKQDDQAGGDDGVEGSVWSDDGLEHQVRERLIARLVNHITSELHVTGATANASDVVSMTTTSQEVAELLRIFATLLDSMAGVGPRHRSTVFVRMQRRRIAADLIGAHAARPSSQDGMTLDEIMLRWIESGVDTAEHPQSLAVPRVEIRNRALEDDSDAVSGIPTDPETENELNIAELPVIEGFLLEGSEFPWLVGQIAAVVSRALESTGNEQELIRAALALALKTAGRDTAGPRQLCLTLPVRCLRTSERLQDAVHVDRLADVICLVGLPDRAYMCTYEEYVHLIWPAVGVEVLRCLDEARSLAGRRHQHQQTADTGMSPIHIGPHKASSPL